MERKYCIENFDLFTTNGNDFSNEASVFLTGNSIPQRIIDLPIVLRQKFTAILPLLGLLTGLKIDANAVERNLAVVVRNRELMQNITDIFIRKDLWSVLKDSRIIPHLLI